MSGPSLSQRAVSAVSAMLQRRVPQGESNTFLEGPFAPVSQERTETQLEVIGALPVELNGLYARIGPNPIHSPNPATYHWFVGDGMVHGVRLSEGRALWYRNRWVGSDTVRKAQGRPMVDGPRRGVADVVNTNVFGHAGQVWASTEAGMLPMELDAQLETKRRGYFNADASLPYSAHPHRDPHTGALHAVCYEATDPRHLHYVVIDAQGHLEKAERITVSNGPMVHDCAITRTQVIVLDLPVTFALGEVLKGSSFPYKWNPRHPARVGLLPKSGSAKDIRWCDVDPCYVFHTCNAFDNDDGSVTLDVVVHDRMFDRSHIGPELEGSSITFERWLIRPQTGRVSRQEILRRSQEFPRFDERLTGEPYRYAYTVSFDLVGQGERALLAYDLHTGEVKCKNFAPGEIPGEAVFVPRSAQAEENDGWLLTLVHEEGVERSSLYVIDARDIAAPPVAVVRLPARVPLGFHGNWIPM